MKLTSKTTTRAHNSNLAIGHKELMELRKSIRKRVVLDFKKVHVTKRLMRTMTGRSLKRTSTLKINAKMYDLYHYFNTKEIIEKEGSYAQLVNFYGGPKNSRHVHKNYVERAITEGIAEWIRKQGFGCPVEVIFK